MCFSTEKKTLWSNIDHTKMFTWKVLNAFFWITYIFQTPFKYIPYILYYLENNIFEID